jgi:hypothetical protein
MYQDPLSNADGSTTILIGRGHIHAYAHRPNFEQQNTIDHTFIAPIIREKRVLLACELESMLRSVRARGGECVQTQQRACS